ncbi:MAG TPA: ChaN family lipoprotein [Flavobacterium sp.]|nr:ChaN family lipoprotein [Flavobacterium sp.]HLF50666.1 ChaN family lipoprotein [Flavobacterium sp.]
MMKAKLFSLIILFFGQIVMAQNKMPYQFFDKNGKKISYKKVLKTAANAEVVLFGEYHDNSVVHWLQLEFTKDLAERKYLVLGAEMIEADNQKQLNQYLKGEIDQKAFDTLARLWPNYKTDYKPLVDFAKEKNIPFIASNIPRRFASLVFKNGFEALEKLTDEEKSWVAPLPIAYDPTMPGYVKMVQEMGGHGGGNMPKAQAVKDATMAYFILKNLKENSVFIHYNGTYHSDNFEGIYWYLKRANAKLKILTIATVSQNDISKLEKEHYNKADLILVVDEDVTKTR